MLRLARSLAELGGELSSWRWREPCWLAFLVHAPPHEAVPPDLRDVLRATHAGSAIVAGMVASLPAALVSALVMTIADRLAGQPATSTLAAIGATVDGDAGTGLLLHGAVALVVGAGWGLVVAFTAHHVPPAAGAFWGALYGLAVWFLAFWLVMPFVIPRLADGTPARVGALFHLAHGATMGALFHAARTGEARRHRLEAERRGRGRGPVETSRG